MKKYEIKRSIKMLCNGDMVKIIFMNKHRELTLRCNKVSKYILQLLAQKVSLDELTSKVKKIYPKVSTSSISKFISTLLKLKVIQQIDSNNKYNNSIVSRQVNFYSDIVKNAEKMQDMLSKKIVLILGLGGVGSCITYFLAQSGIKNFILVDKDKVENTNLGRQALYFKDDIGKYKVDILSSRLKKLDPRIQIQKYKISIRNTMDFHSIINIPDIVVNCLDEPNGYITGKWVTDYYLKLKVPMINGIGYRGSTVSLGLTTIPEKTICWNCANIFYKKEIKGYLPFLNDKFKSQAGVTSPLANFIGSIHAQEVINILCNELSPILINRIGMIDFSTLSVRWIDLNCSDKQRCKYCKGINKE